MANEKILNTRIQLKYDSLANWNEKNPLLKAGEVAIAYLATTDAVAPGTDDTQHPVLFKVGPGNFKNLPWASALAADVYGWAKKPEAEFITWVKSLIDVTDVNTYNKTQIDTKLSENSTADQKYAKDYADSLAKNYDPAGKAQELINTLNVNDSAVTGKYVSAVSEENGKITVTREDLPTHTLTSGSVNGTVAFDGKDVAVTGLGSAAYQNANAFDAAGAAATAKSEAITEAETKVNALANGAVKNNADAIAAIKDHDSVDSFADVMTEMSKYQLAGDYATKAEAQGYANAKDSAIAEAKKAGTDAAAALEAYKTSNNQALADEIARAKAAEAQVLVDAKAYAEDLKDSILGEGISETFDTLKEIQTWIEGDGVNATELSGAIAAEAKLRADEDSRLEGLIEANADAIAALNVTDGKVANAAYADKANSLTDAAKEEVKAVKVNNATNADVANSLTDNAKAEVKAVKVDNAAHADAADNATKLGGVAAADYATKAYADQAEADAIASANANTANVIKNYYTKSEADAAFMDSTETGNAIDAKITALNLGATYEPIGAETRAKAYADSLAGNYATAAQGAKADTALQEITTTANGGLKVTNKNHIDIDPDVVFVFQCGSASVLVD